MYSCSGLANTWLAAAVIVCGKTDTAPRIPGPSATAVSTAAWPILLSAAGWPLIPFPDNELMN